MPFRLFQLRTAPFNNRFKHPFHDSPQSTVPVSVPRRRNRSNGPREQSLFQRGCHARDVDGRTRVEQYRRARSAPVHPGQHRLENFRILLRIPAPELLRRIDGSKQKFRQKFTGDDAAVTQFRNPGGGTAADLIEPVEPCTTSARRTPSSCSAPAKSSVSSGA